MRTERARTLRAFAGRGSLALAALLTLGACGGGAAGLAAESAAALHEQVAAVRTAANTDDRIAADAAVGAFRAEVRRLADAGELSPAEARSLLEYADQISSGIGVEVTATPTPTPTRTPSPERAEAAAPTRPTADEPATTITAEELRAAQQRMADRLTELLRERIQERLREQAAENKADSKKSDGKSSDGKKSARKSGDGHGDGGDK